VNRYSIELLQIVTDSNSVIFNVIVKKIHEDLGKAHINFNFS